MTPTLKKSVSLQSRFDVVTITVQSLETPKLKTDKLSDIKDESLANADSKTTSQTDKTAAQHKNNEEHQASSLMNRLSTASLSNQASSINNVAYSK